MSVSLFSLQWVNSSSGSVLFTTHPAVFRHLQVVEMEFFKFFDKFDKEFRCPKIYSRCGSYCLFAHHSGRRFLLGVLF